LIPGLGRSAAEGMGYPLQYSWASLVAQLVKNLPAMWETWVWSLDWEDFLEKGKTTHCNILAWRIPSTVYSMRLQSQTWLNNLHSLTHSFTLEISREVSQWPKNRTIIWPWKLLLGIVI